MRVKFKIFLINISNALLFSLSSYAKLSFKISQPNTVIHICDILFFQLEESTLLFLIK